MNEVSEKVEKLIEQFKQERDELRVRAHLAKGELAEEWEKLENKLHKLESRSKELKDASVAASVDIGAAAQLLADELRKGFAKVRKQL